MSTENATKSVSLITGFSRRLFLSTALAMIIAALLSLIVTVVYFNAGLRPYLVDKARAVAESVQQDIQYAISIGIPFEEIRGLEQHITKLVDEHPEVREMRVVVASEQADIPKKGASDRVAERDATTEEGLGYQVITSISEIGSILFRAGDAQEVISVEIVENDTVVAKIESVVDETYMNGKMTSVFFDTLVILIAVSLVALEVVVVLSASQLAEPFRVVERALNKRAGGDLRQYEGGIGRGRLSSFVKTLNVYNAALRDRVNAARESVADAGRKAKLSKLAERTSLFITDKRQQASIMDARIPLFVFCFAEELQKSFLPLFVAEFYSENDLFSRDIMMGLPISAFMFVIAVFTPFAGKLVDKFGNKPLFLAGLLPAIAGYLFCYMAQSGNDILIGRSMTAIGYAVITISCQSYIAAVVVAENRARGMAVFVGVLMTATMCGTAIGAILADWLGYKPVFLVATGFAVMAGILGYSMLSTDLPAPEKKKEPVGVSRSPIATLLRNSQFVLIVLFCAIPAKVILTGFLYLFVPIYLASLDATQSEIGRVMMLYSLIIIPISPLASGFADRLGKNLWMVIGATIASGIVLLGLYQSASVAMVLSVVVALGLVHSFLKAPLIVAAMEAAEKSPDITRTGALSLLRTSERIGSVIGPVVVAALLVILDFGEVAAILGITVAILGIIMAILSFNKKGPEAHA
jgi:predicted MFS family arabinose efflux permease